MLTSFYITIEESNSSFRTGMINKEIGKYFNGISDSAVAKINVRFINEMEKDKRIREWVFRLEKNLSNVKG